jgi:hypothetical protein
MFAQPLHVGCDVRNMSAEIVAILTNADVLAVDQDPLVRPAARVGRVNASNAGGHAARADAFRRRREGAAAVAGGGSVSLPAARRDADAAEVGGGWAARADACPAWNLTTGGYNETCQGPAGNIFCFVNTTLADANVTCCGDAACAGFSYHAADGSGCYKYDMACGFVADPGFAGYSKPGFVPPPDGDVYARPLADASAAVLLLNRGAAPLSMCATWGDAGLNPAVPGAFVRDLWAQSDLGWVAGPEYCDVVQPHDVAMLRLSQ